MKSPRSRSVRAVIATLAILLEFAFFLIAISGSHDFGQVMSAIPWAVVPIAFSAAVGTLASRALMHDPKTLSRRILSSVLGGLSAAVAFTALAWLLWSLSGPSDDLAGILIIATGALVAFPLGAVFGALGLCDMEQPLAAPDDDKGD